MTRLRQGKAPQLRLLPAATMPRAPLERHLVDAIRLVVHRMGLVSWSGRIAVFGHKPPFLPVLGAGTPDVLVLLRDSRLVGLEAKRDAASVERESQLLWRAQYPGVAVATVRTVEEAVTFLKEQMR